MKMNVKSISLLVTCLALLASCNNPNDDPAPSDPVNVEYRLKKFVSRGEDRFVTETYSYKADGTLDKIMIDDSAGMETRTISFDRNASGDIIYYSEIYGSSNQYAYAFEYNQDRLVQSKKYYSDPEGANTLQGTTTYFYKGNKDLHYYLYINSIGNKDSVAFGQYSNNRPSVKRHYRLNGDTYELVQKTLYTYDARMNRSKEERTNYNSDTTVFYTVEENEFEILDAKHQLAYEKSLVSDFVYLYDDNPSFVSKDKNKDSNTKVSYSSSCGKSSSFSSEIVEENEGGYPLKVNATIELYTCGTPTSSEVEVLTFEYDQF